VSTEEDRIWHAELDRVADDARARFNAAHGHTPGCEFVVDDWICGEGCEAEDTRGEDL
jgi:hypothetical protein